jgi:hypothetical protein
MTPADLIDQYIDEYEGGDPADTNNARKRRRTLGYVNHVCSVIESFRNWSWMYGEDSVTIPVGTNLIALVTPFDGPSVHTRIFVEGTKREFTYVSPGKLEDLRQRNIVCDAYSVFDGAFQIPFTTPVDLDLFLFYRKSTTRYGDTTTTIRIPDSYRDSVVFPGVVALGQEGKLDGRGTWASAFKTGMSLMCAKENPVQEGITMLPLRMNFW